MRRLRALIGAMRTRRTGRIDRAEADRLIAGGWPGREHPGLGHLLDAARAPATAEELGGERVMAAALAEARRRAVSTTTPKGRTRVQVPLSARTVLVNITAGLALLSAGGTAVAAETGHLPAGAQQHAHRLFSALGVPAPRTGTPTATPAPSPSVPPVRPSPTPSPHPAVTGATAVPPGWCTAWRAAPDGKAMNAKQRLALIAAAGGEQNVDEYCARSTATTATTTATPGAAGATGRKAHGKPSTHPTPHATTPSHPGRPK